MSPSSWFKRSLLSVIACSSLASGLSSCSVTSEVRVTAYLSSALCAATIESDYFFSYQGSFDISSINSDVVICPIQEAQAAIDEGWNYQFIRPTQSLNLYACTVGGTPVTEVSDDDIFLVSSLFESEINAVKDLLGLNDNQIIVASSVRDVEESATSGTYQEQEITGVILAEPYMTIAIGANLARSLKPLTSLKDSNQYDEFYGLYFSDSFMEDPLASNVEEDVNQTLEDLAERGGNQTISTLFQMEENDVISCFGANPSIVQSLLLYRDEDGWYQAQNRLCYLA